MSSSNPAVPGPSSGSSNVLVEALSNLDYTDNGGLTQASTSDARLDLFYGLKEHVACETAQTLVHASWHVSPLDTLKLIFYALDVRQGKSINTIALFCLQGLWPEHPKTLLAALKHVPEFGCWRDLATFLSLFRQDATDSRKLEEMAAHNQDLFGRCRSQGNRKGYGSKRKQKWGDQYKQMYAAMRTKPIPAELKQEVVHLFSHALTADLTAVVSEIGKPSLAAKWMPSQGKSLDKQTELYDAVAQKLYNQPLDTDEQGQVTDAARNKARNHLRKTYLTPLRSALHVVEVDMSAKRWGDIRYSSVPSLSMMRNSPAFEYHDSDRYIQYVLDAARGKTKLNVATLKPHQIVASAHTTQRPTQKVLVNAQWATFVDHIKSQGNLPPSLAVVDVSGSMYGLPMDVACSLGLLLSQITPEPWHGHVITFSALPQFHHIKGDKLTDQLGSLARMDWGMNTDFIKVFKLILGRAKAHNVPESDMPKTLFVFSDMQFDAAAGRMANGKEQTHFESVKAMYHEAGYEMPQLVFWNLDCSPHYGTPNLVPDTRAPVTFREDGTALVSGFSANLLKLFLEGVSPSEWVLVEEEDAMDVEEVKPEDAAKKPVKAQPKMDPLAILRKAIDDERFGVLEVLD